MFNLLYIVVNFCENLQKIEYIMFYIYYINILYIMRTIYPRHINWIPQVNNLFEDLKLAIEHNIINSNTRPLIGIHHFERDCKGMIIVNERIFYKYKIGNNNNIIIDILS